MRLQLAAVAAVLCAPSLAAAAPTGCSSADVPPSIATANCNGRCTVVPIGGVPVLTCGLGAYGANNFATAVNYTGSDVTVWGTTDVGGGSTTYFCCVDDLANFERVELHGGTQIDVFSFQYYESTTATWYGLEGTTSDPIDEGYMSGKSGTDTLIGSSVNDPTVYHHDHLRGDGDDDDVCGGAGPNDILDGASGDDVLWDTAWSGIIGGSGFDECPFYSPLSPPSGASCNLNPPLASPPGVCP